MDWIRRNPKSAVALSALAVLCAIVFVWAVSGGSGSPSDATPTLGPPTATESLSNPLSALPTPSATPTSVEGQVAAGIAGGIKGGGTFNMAGIKGGSLYKHLPRHHLDLTVTSNAPIGIVGYIIPTSMNESSGINKNVQESWHLSTTVYGDPDYAQLFMQAGARGYVITCTITVDGRVTEHRSTEGPYGQQMCQG